jgi:hypothetical protein
MITTLVWKDKHSVQDTKKAPSRCFFYVNNVWQKV